MPDRPGCQATAGCPRWSLFQATHPATPAPHKTGFPGLGPGPAFGLLRDKAGNGKGWGLLKGIDTNSGQTGWKQHPSVCTQTKEHAWGCRDNKGLKSQLETGTSLWLMGRRAAIGPLGQGTGDGHWRQGPCDPPVAQRGSDRPVPHVGSGCCPSRCREDASAKHHHSWRLVKCNSNILNCMTSKEMMRCFP